VSVISKATSSERRERAVAIDVLTDRERRIFEARYLADEPPKLEDLAREFDVSIELN
jgi:RNA polymerase sigma-32 factor